MDKTTKRAIVYAVIVTAAFAAIAAADPKPHANPCSDTCDISHADTTMPGMGSMPGMDASPAADRMNGAATSSMPMGAHMTMTPAMPAHPGDAQRAAGIVAALTSAIARYQDYRVAERDGFEPFLAQIPQPQYHFTNRRNAVQAEIAFDPTKPTSLLYQKTATGYRLIGAMFTAPRSSTLAQLDARVPLSIARWHEHVNFCKGPPGSTLQDYLGPRARFGLAGSIATQDACAAAGGTFVPLIYNWMVHVYLYATNPADVWKVSM